MFFYRHLTVTFSMQNSDKIITKAALFYATLDLYSTGSTALPIDTTIDALLFIVIAISGTVSRRIFAY